MYIYIYIIWYTWALCLSWNTYDLLFSLTSKKKEQWRDRRKQSYLRWAHEVARLLTTRHVFVCFDVTSPADIDCVWSSLGLACFCGRKCFVTHRVFKSHRYLNINVLNTLICITFILMHLWNKLTGFYVIWVWLSNRRVAVIWQFCSLFSCFFIWLF